MNRIRQTASTALLVALVALCATAAQAQSPYRMSNRRVNNLLRRVETDADRFRSSFANALDRSRYNGTSTEDQLNGYVQNFESATDQLRSRFNARTSAAADVENVLRQAAFLNEFMMRNNLSANASNDWTTLRADLDALARAYNVTWDWAQTGSSYGNDGNTGYGNNGGPTGVAYRVSDRQLDALIRRIENGTDRFRSDMGSALNGSAYNGTRAEDNINQFVRDFENATDQLRSRFNSRNSATADVENVLRQATYIDDFMRRNRLSYRAENDWTTLRGELSQLATAYSVAWNWDVNALPGYGTTAGGYGDNNGGGTRAENRLTGTFRLEPSQSDNPNTAVENATRNLPYADRQRVHDQLMRRLEAPEMLAIERNGNNVTIASSRAPQTTFVANSPESREQLPNGGYSRVNAQLNGDRLVVSSAGNRETDFTVTFDPIEGGRRLRVTRQIWNDRLGANPLTVTNVYDRTADVAQWNVYTGTTAGYDRNNGPYNNNNNNGGGFVVPDGQVLTARLDTDLSTRTASVGDRFAMTVTSPGQFEGSVIEGRIASVNRSGRVTGRSDMSLNFDTIRTRDGRTYQFAGFIESVRAQSGETVQVDNEGTVRDDSSRGSTTAQRAAIGSAVGAIIGAIAGGGKGAVIGAVLGGGAGAGSVYVQGSEDLNLMSGTEVSIRASAPTNR
ncbi:MAG TPA: hypothetical protein VE642_04935 [Pyrinomonadaceae bacterium]|nr:hypothetical protein [Pyrinomonadaceae bacterium]